MKRWSFLVAGIILVGAIAVLAYTRLNISDQPAEPAEVAANKKGTAGKPADPIEPSTRAIASDNLPRETETLFIELADYERCYLQTDCVTPESDARAAHFFVVQEISERLDQLVALTRQVQTDSSRFIETARQFLVFPDGRVQAQALILMGSMPPVKGNARAVINALKNHHDARLFELAMVELQRYPNDYRMTDDFLIDTLKTGGHYASQTVARKLLPILRENNIERYEKTATELPPNTAKARYLKQVLNEYHLLQQGG